MSREITMAEVKLHNKKSDFWTVIHGKVYDVTSFVDGHPGGDVILEVAGKDGTENFDDIGHSDSAKAELRSLKIGVLRS